MKTSLIEVTTSLNRQVPEVFAFVSEQQNATKWQRGLVEVRRLTDGPLGVGTRHAFVRKMMGRRLEADNEYTAFEPNQQVTFKTISGPVELEASYITAPSAGGTDLTCRMHLSRGTGLTALMHPLIVRSIRKQMARDFATLKGLLDDPAVNARSAP